MRAYAVNTHKHRYTRKGMILSYSDLQYKFTETHEGKKLEYRFCDVFIAMFFECEYLTQL